MKKTGNQNNFRSIYNSTISNKKATYGEESDYLWDQNRQELRDSTFGGVRGYVGMTNQKGRAEGDNLIAPHHWD